MPNKKKLYEALKAEGYDNFADEASFNSYVDNADNRKKLFSALKQEGYDNFADESEFDKYLGYNSESNPEFEANTERIRNGQPTQKVTTQSVIDANPELGDITQGSYQYKPEVQQYILQNKPDMFKQNKGMSLMDVPLNVSSDAIEGAPTMDKFKARVEVAQNNLQDPIVQKGRNEAEVRGLISDIDSDLADIEEKISARKKALRGTTNAREDRGLAQYRGDRSYLEGAKELMEESQKLINAAKDEKNGTFVGGVLRGTRDKAFDVNTWTMGISDLVGGLRLKRVLEDFEAGKELTSAQEKLLDAAVTNMATTALFTSDLGNGYKAGQVTGESLPFMLEMMINPISASGNAMAKSLLNAGLKRFGKNKAAQVGARLVGDALAATGMAATTGMPGVLGETVDRLNQNYNYGVDSDGKLYVEKTGETSFGEAFARSFATRAIENQSEMIFKAFEPIGGFMKGVQDVLPGGVNKFFDLLKHNKAADVYRYIKNSPVFRNYLVKDVRNATQIGGIGEEYLEEVYNNLANFAIGEMKWEDVVSLDNNIDTFLGLVPTQVMFGMLGLGGAGAMRYQTRRTLEDLQATMNEQQRKELEGLLDMGLDAKEVDVRGFIRGVMDNQSYTIENKRDLIKAAYYVAKQRSIDELTETDVIDKVNAEYALIDNMTDPSTGNYAEVNRLVTNAETGEREPQAGYVVGWIGEGEKRQPVFVADGMENTYENRMVLKPTEWDKESYQEMPSEEVKAYSEEMIREEAAQQAEREAKYAPEVLSQQIPTEPFVIDGEMYIPSQSTPDGQLYDIYPVDESGKPTSNVPIRVEPLSIDEYHDKLQVQYEAQQAQQAESEQAQASTQSIVEGMGAKPMDDGTGRVMQPKGLEGDKVVYDIADAEGNVLEEGSMDVAKYNGVEENEANVDQSESAQEASVGGVSAQDTKERGPVVEAPAIPTKADESIDFVTYGKEGTFKTLSEKYGEKMPKKVAVTAKAYAEDLKKAQDKLAKAEEAYDNAPIGREEKAEKARDKARQELDEIKKEADFWAELDNEIKEAQSRREAILNPQAEVEISTEPMNADEFVAQQLASGNIVLSKEDSKKETGFGDEEANAMNGGTAKMLKADGMTIQEAGERLMEMDRENGTNFFDQSDSNAGRDALISLLGSVKNRKGLNDYIANNRAEQAKRESEGLRNELEKQVMDANYASLEDYVLQMEAEEMQENPFQGLDLAQIDAIFAEVEEEYQNFINNEQGRTSEIVEGNDNVLSEEQSDDTGGTSGIESEGNSEGNGEGTADESEAAHASEEVEQPLEMREGETALEFAERVVEEERRKPLRERAKEWERKLGVKVNIMESLDAVTNKDARRAIMRGQRVTGWFEESTGEVCLYMPYLESESEIDATYIHEVVAHKGLRELLGDKFDAFCDEVWDSMSVMDKAKFMTYPGVNGNKRAAADEYIAHLSENIDVTESAWSQLTELIKRFLKAIGLEPKMTNADIANTIKKSYQRLLEGGATENAVGEGTRFSVLDEVNEAYNKRLLELDNDPNQKDRVLRLGRPSNFLKDGGIVDADIEMEFDKFVRKSDENYKNDHPFTANDIMDLPKAINAPIAVFDSTNHRDKVILTELNKDGNNFIVAVKAVQRRRKGGVVLEVNEIATLYPKNARGIVNWINNGLAVNVNKEKALHWLEALRTHHGTGLSNEELIDATKIINDSDKTKESGENSRFRTVYHGSGASFNKFDHSFMGTGEGAQAYGWGTYVTEVEGIARTYATTMGAKNGSDPLTYVGDYENYVGKDVVRIAKAYMRDNNFDLKKAKEEAEHDLKQNMPALSRKGAEFLLGTTEQDWSYSPNRHLYEVEIPDNDGTNYIAWDKKLSQAQADRIKDAVLNSDVFKNYSEEYGKGIATERLNYWLNGVNGGRVYRSLENFIDYGKGSDKAISQLLSDAGFVGIEYPAEYRSGGRDDNAKNYVIFNEHDLDIVEHTRFRAVTDKKLIDKLESEPKIKVYRAMQLVDGKLYPPMSAKVDGKMREPIELGKWEMAEERPDLADEKGYFKLDKGNKTSLKARYNPYIHTSTTPLNDQFSSAQTRPELVTVEVEIPESELTSGYKAEKAKDAVGKLEWKAGVVQGKLSGTRTVILSRYDKPVRIVPDSEVAAEIVKMFDGRDITMPSNVVTPSLRAELEKLGVPFVETDNRGREVGTRFRLTKEEQSIIDQAKADGSYMKAPNGEPTNLNEKQWAQVRTKAFKEWFGDWENDSENASKVMDENGEPMVVYHGSEEDFNVFDKTKGRANMDIQGMFFSPWDDDARGYGSNVRAFYLNIKNPANENTGYKALKKYQGQNGAGIKAREYLASIGYDGVNNEDQEFIAFESNQIKSATDNVGTFDESNNDIRFRFIGEKGARNLDKAEEATTRLDNLAVAREMEAAEKDAKTIKMATGWERGADGLWRYEVKDVLNESYLLKIAKESYNKGVGHIKPLSFFYEAGDTLRDEYPRLSNIDVSFTAFDNPNTHGRYIPSINMIEVNKDLYKNVAYYEKKVKDYKKLAKDWENPSEKDLKMLEALLPGVSSDEHLEEIKWKLGEYKAGLKKMKEILLEYLKSSIVHEAQHAIQHVEGFARGGSVGTVRTRKDDLQADVRRLYDMMLDTAEWAEMQRLVNEYMDNPENESVLSRIDEIDESGVLDGIKKLQQSLKNKYGNDAIVGKIISSPYAEHDEIWDQLPDSFNDKYDVYNRLGGEVEARNAAARSLSLTQKEMLKSLAESTEDVAREDQIFLKESVMEGQTVFRVTKREAEKAIRDFEGIVNVHPQFNMVNSDSDIDDLPTDKWTKDRLKEKSKDSTETGVTIYEDNLVVIFGENVKDLEELNDVLSHESAHYVSRKFGIEDVYKASALGYVQKHYPDEYAKIVDRYIKEKHPEEAVAVLFEKKSKEIGIKKLLSATFDTKNDIGYLFNQLTQYLNHGEGISGHQKGVSDKRDSGAETAQTPTNGQRGEVAEGVRGTLEGSESKQGERRERKARLTDLFTRVADMGLQGVLGNKEYDRMMMDIYSALPEDARNEIVEDTFKHYGVDFVPAVSDYINAKADGSLWDKIVTIVREALRKVGFDLDLNANEVKYLAWRSKKPLDRNNLLEVAEDIDMKHRLKVGEYDGSPTPDGGGTKFRIGKAKKEKIDLADDRDSLIKKYDEELKTKAFNFQEAFQDRMLSLKVLMQLIEEQSGKKAKGFEDAYKAENQLGSVNRPAQKKWLEDFYKPLLEELQKLEKKYGRKEVERYIYCKSGLERNEVLRQRDAEEAYNEAKEELDEKLAKNEIDHNQYAVLMKQVEDERKKTLATDTDYSGIRGLLMNTRAEELYEQFKNGSIKEAEYKQKVEDLKNNEAKITKDWKKFAEDQVAYLEGKANTSELDALWDKINAATNETLRIDFESGMIDRATYEAEKNMMKYYVPLRNWENTTAEDMYEYRHDMTPAVTSNQQKAKGRKSQADNPIATIALMAQNAIVRGNRNRMKQKLFNFVINRPTALASVRNVWYVRDANNQWVPTYADTSTATNQDEINQIVEQFETDMEALAAQGDAFKGKMKQGMNYRANRKQKDEHVVTVMINGKEYGVYINGNPRAAQAVNGLTNAEGVDDAGKWIDALKRYYGAGLTSWNPYFIIPNLVRDSIHATTMTYLDKGVMGAAKYAWNMPKMFAHVAKEVSGITTGNPKLHQYFEEFVKNGGETGYTAIHTLEDYKKEYDKLMDEAKGVKKSLAKGSKDTLKTILKLLEAANRIAEDVNRFNAYVTSRESGANIVNSIDAAKNITVNFNRKGALSANNTYFGKIASLMSRWILFFNPSVQGMYQLVTKSKVNPKRAIGMGATILASGFLMPMLNELLVAAFGGDEDDYWNQSDYKRRNNWMVFAGDGYVTIPLPPVLRELYGMGDIMYGVITGHITPQRAVYDTLKQIQSAIGFVNLLPEISHEPDMITYVKGFAPDLFAPAMDIVSNTNFMGRPIAKWETWNENSPEYERVYKGVSPHWVELSKLLNEIGGNETRRSDDWGNFINPAMMEHLWNSYTGGIGKTINNLAGMAVDAIKGDTENMDVFRKTPIIPRFFTPTDEKSVYPGINRKFYEFEYQYNNASKSLKKSENGVKSGEHPEWQKYIDEMEKNGEKKFIEYFKKEQKKLKKLQDKLKENPNDKDAEKKVYDKKAEISTESFKILSGQKN